MEKIFNLLINKDKMPKNKFKKFFCGRQKLRCITREVEEISLAEGSTSGDTDNFKFCVPEHAYFWKFSPIPFTS